MAFFFGCVFLAAGLPLTVFLLEVLLDAFLSLILVLGLRGALVFLSFSVLFFFCLDSFSFVEASVFFGSIVSLMENYNDTPKHETLIIDMTNVTMIDLSGIYVLEDIIKVARDKGVTVFVSNANVHIKTVLEKVNFIKNIGEENYKDLKKW